MSSINKLKFLGVPLAIQYTFSTRKVDIMPSIGLQANFLTGKSIETVLTNGYFKERQNIQAIEGLKKMYFNTLVSVAIQYSFNRRISVDLIPSANFAMGSINKNAVVKSYPDMFGLAAGMRLQL